MIKRMILVITPSTEFAERLCFSLKKNQTNVPIRFFNKESVSDFVNDSSSIHYALIDSEFNLEDIRELVNIIRDKFPFAEIIFISKSPLTDQFEDLRPWKLLSKPFTEADLLMLINKDQYLTDREVIEGYVREESRVNIPLWSQDEIALSNSIHYAFSNLDAQEALLFSGGKIIASVGKLNKAETEDCGRLLQKHLTDVSRGELIKQIWVNDNQYIFHLIVLAVGIILVLFYLPETPYKLVREQTLYLVDKITNPKLSAGSKIPILKNSLTEKTQSLYPTWVKEVMSDNFNLRNRKQTHRWPARKLRRFISATEMHEGQIVPENNTSNRSSNNYDSYFEDDEEDGIDQTELESLYGFPVPEPDPVKGNLLAKGAIPDRINSTSLQNLADTKPFLPKENIQKTLSKEDHDMENHQIIYSTIGIGKSCIPLACLLIPRYKANNKPKDLAKFLLDEIPSIFLAYGWRLESLLVHQDFLQWIVSLPPTIAPSTHIQIIRKESTKLIFTNIESYSKGGLIKDFWAPGYLFEIGNQNIKESTIVDFIKANRHEYYPREGFIQMPNQKSIYI